MAAETGQQAYEQNCKACHALDIAAVGPSLVEIRQLYPQEKQAQFLAWSKNPGKKRANAVQMPAMAHLGDGLLTDIHQYILTISKGVKISKKRHNFSFKAPPKIYPYYRRGHMPFASPAAIGVMFKPNLGLNWDASICQMRYVFVSGANFFNGENNQDKLKKDLVYQGTAEQLWSFAENKEIDFLGYRLVEELPEFICQVGDIRIKERFMLAENGQRLSRIFSVTGVNQPFVMNLSHEGTAKINASTGHLIDGKLTLTPKQASSYTVTVEIK